jgi:hypothetical protein
MSERNLICFLTVKPGELFYNFVKQLPNKDDIYICIDDDQWSIPNYNNEIKLIQINRSVCEDSGFKGSLLWIPDKALFIDKAASRDKALYYFCKNNIEYDNVWFIEDDVFIPTVDTIQNIDNKYSNCDLLVKSNDIIYERHYHWHWAHINQQVKLEPPYSCSMISAIRCSRKLLACINDYAEKYNSLFMDEALFTTLAIHNNLNIITPPELSTIEYWMDWQKTNINTDNMYHPVKDINKQYEFRT